MSLEKVVYTAHAKATGGRERFALNIQDYFSSGVGVRSINSGQKTVGHQKQNISLSGR